MNNFISSLLAVLVVAFAACGPVLAAQSQTPVAVQAAQAVPKSVRPVSAQDALTQCLIQSTSANDKRVLVKWVFAVIAQHPDISAMTKIDAAQRTAIDRDAAKVLEQLLTGQCAVPLRTAMKQSGTDAIGRSFQTLGTSAATDMLQNPQVVASGAGLMKHLDMQRILLALIVP
jgi:ethanolamine utilization protein EutP (predicted NTPase)